MLHHKNNTLFMSYLSCHDQSIIRQSKRAIIRLFLILWTTSIKNFGVKSSGYYYYYFFFRWLVYDSTEPYRLVFASTSVMHWRHLWTDFSTFLVGTFNTSFFVICPSLWSVRVNVLWQRQEISGCVFNAMSEDWRAFYAMANVWLLSPFFLFWRIEDK